MYFDSLQGLTLGGRTSDVQIGSSFFNKFVMYLLDGDTDYLWAKVFDGLVSSTFSSIETDISSNTIMIVIKDYDGMLILLDRNTGNIKKVLDFSYYSQIDCYNGCEALFLQS